MPDNQDGCEWVSFFWYRPIRVIIIIIIIAMTMFMVLSS